MPIKIRLVAVGRVKDKRIRDCISEFETRIRPFAKLETLELPDSGIKKESEKIAGYVDGMPSFILDAKGKEYSSDEFASLLKQNAEAGIVLIIGGPDGISEDVKKTARLISLSRMTFTHEMARLFLVEQIYRSMMINTNRKYHR
jgi:23S rRNA (pseudouridine1915-N3)-methyltransferase